MCSVCPGNYEDPDATAETTIHAFAGTEEIEVKVRDSGYAPMDGERTVFMCSCGEPFDTHDELNFHIADMNAAQVAHASNVNSRFLISALMGGF